MSGHGHEDPHPDDSWEVSTGEALAFLEQALRVRAHGSAPSVLDVGAGQGRIAAAMTARGWRVRAIEPDAEAAALARARRVEIDALDAVEDEGTQRARALAVPGGYDAAFFGRSLHHVRDAGRALRFAHGLLAQGAPLVLEEFAWDRADRATAAWFFGRWDPAEADGRLERRDRDDAEDPSLDPLARWKGAFEHDPPLLTGDAMLEAVRALAGTEITVTEAPGLYRFFEQRSRTADPAWIRALLAEERAAIAAGTIHAVGLRVVAYPGASASGSGAPGT